MSFEMKRYSVISVNGLIGDGENLYVDKLVFKHFGKSLADRSHFVPTVDLTANTGNITEGDRAYYDFPDGKDTGLKVPRISRGKDIAEIIVEARECKSDVDKAISDAKSEKDYEDRIKKLVEGSSSSPSPSVAETD